MFKEKITAFPDGNSIASYNNALEKLVIGNSEGLVKIFDVKEPDLEPEALDIYENLTSISSFGDKLIVTSISGALESVDLKNNAPEGTLFRSELPLRHAVLINAAERVVCGGDDNKLAIISLLNDKNVSLLTIPEQLVHLSYNETREILAASLCNGDIQLYSVINEQPKLLDTIPNVLHKKFHTSLGKIDYLEEHKEELIATRTQWSSNGEYFLVAANNNAIKLYERADFHNEQKEFKDENLNAEIVDFSICPSDAYLAVCYKDLHLKIFDMETGRVVKSEVLNDLRGHLPINLTWCDSPGALTYALYMGITDGSTLTIKEVVDKKAKKVAESLFVNEESEPDDRGNLQHASGKASTASTTNNLKLHEEDSLVIDEEDDGQDTLLENYNKSVEDLIDDKHPRKKHKINGDYGKHVSLQQSKHYSDYNVPKIEPYSPGSTPWSQGRQSTISGTNRRYLCMNSIGYVWSVRSQPNHHQQSITTSFFDRSKNKDYYFIDYNNFDLCSIVDDGILFATSGFNDNNDPNSGKIFYRQHSNIQEVWEKKVPLLENEYITCISLSNNNSSGDRHSNGVIVVGTNLGYCRFFDVNGICLYVIKTLPVVALMSSSKSILFMINELSTNVYCYSLIDIGSNCKYIQQDVLMPLKKHHHATPLLKGMFYNEHNDPCVVPGSDDTLMTLSSWREQHNAKWIPLLNCRDAVTEYGNNESKANWKCWPLGLSYEKLNCLVLKTESPFPGFPLSLPIELDIRLPIYDRSTQNPIGDTIPKDSNDEDPEENFLKVSTMGKMISDSLKEEADEEMKEEMLEKLQSYSLIFDKSLLKLFASACQDSRLTKAMSIAKLIKNERALLAATKISERFEFLNLASKISKLREEIVVDNEDHM